MPNSRYERKCTLAEKTLQKTGSHAEDPTVVIPEAGDSLHVSGVVEDNGRENGRRARRARNGGAGTVGTPQEFSPGASPHGGDDHDPLLGTEEIKAARRTRRAGRIARGQTSSLPHEGPVASADGTPELDPEAAVGAAADVETSDTVAPLALDPAGSTKRATRTAARVRKKQAAAKDAVASLGDRDNEHPAIGALNRHLNMMTQQLITAHRVVGRVGAERDALRQQLADIQGVPVEDIVVSSIGTFSEQSEKSTTVSAPPPKSTMAKLNYFGGDDIAVMRKRRQMLALGIVATIVMIGVAIRMGLWAMPENISRESLTGIPYIGDLMAVFLAGWMFFRLIRVSSKGVKWVFPSEDQRRRRR